MKGIHSQSYTQEKTFTILDFSHHPMTKTWYVHITLLLLAGSTMMAHGARMIYQGVFHPTSTYSPNTFDLIFDWLTLLIIGSLILSLTINSYYHHLTTHHQRKRHILQQQHT